MKTAGEIQKRRACEKTALLRTQCNENWSNLPAVLKITYLHLGQCRLLVIRMRFKRIVLYVAPINSISELGWCLYIYSYVLY